MDGSLTPKQREIVGKRKFEVEDEIINPKSKS